MTETELVAGLQTLRHILEDMKALLAWQKLKSHEARQGPSSFIRFNNTASKDLMDKYSSFLSLAMQIHQALDDSNARLTDSQYRRIKKQLELIEAQTYYLGSPIRVY
ncbi:hypothetical protein ACFL3G_01945 [Planctomycetota bacterium]